MSSIQFISGSLRIKVFTLRAIGVIRENRRQLLPLV